MEITVQRVLYKPPAIWWYRVLVTSTPPILVMKLLLLSLLAFPALSTLVSAQPAAAPPVAAVDPARTKALQKQADAAQKEVDAITADLRRTDDRIEARISKAVERLATYTDSKDSGTRIAEAKANVIDFLRKQITDYAQRRAQVRGQLENRQRVIPIGILEADLAKIDARIDRRIEQAIALGGTFARHEDYDKYDATGAGWYGHTEYRINEDWKANRRATLKSAKEKGKLGDAIDDNIRRLESTNRYKQSQLAAAKPETARLLKADIARNQSLVNALENARETFLSPTTADMTPVGALEAKSITERLQKAGAEVRREQGKLTGYYNNLNAARARQAPLLRALGQATAPQP